MGMLILSCIVLYQAAYQMFEMTIIPTCSAAAALCAVFSLIVLSRVNCDVILHPKGIKALQVVKLKADFLLRKKLFSSLKKLIIDYEVILTLQTS